MLWAFVTLQTVFSREVVLFLEGPLSKVPLYNPYLIISSSSYDLDVAIGAPFSDSGASGTVYIYHSSRIQTLTLNPQQVC